MFSSRCQLSGARKYSREFFEKLVSDLTAAGFEDISVLLPHTVVPTSETKLTVAELLRRERNYPSLILLARSTERSETLKVLFVNRNSTAVFIDDTFPDAKSEPPQLYFQSPDPGRTYAVFRFFREYLERPGLGRFWFVWTTGMSSVLVMWAQAISFLTNQKLLLRSRFDAHPIFDVLVLCICVVGLYRFFGEPRGLWIKPKRELRLLYLANMALRGDFRDNPLVTLVITIAGSVLTVLILRWFGISG